MSKFISGSKLLTRSFAFFKGEKRKYILGVIFASFELALLFATPYINKMLIEIVTGKSQYNIVMTVAVLFVMFLLFAPLVILGKYWQNITSERATIEMRKSVFSHIMNMPYNILSKYKTGDYITRLTNDVNSAGTVFTSFAMVSLTRFVVVMSITLVLLLIYDWRIALAGIIYSIICLVLSVLLNPYVKRLEREAKLQIVNSSSFLIEAMRGIPIVRVFTLHDTLAKEYRNICQIIREKRIKFRTINGIAYGAIDFFAFSAQAVGFIIAILLSSNNVELGNAVFNATLMGLMADSMLRLSTFLLLIQPRLVSMQRVFEILDLPEENLAENSEKIACIGDNAVSFKNVSFSYNEGSKIIDNLALDIKNGEHLAIVGGSGGGKSTLIKLIQDFYTPTSGKIAFFGKDISDISTADIRKLSSYIPQECSLFEGTIGENIGFGRVGSTDTDIIAAAKKANIHEFIETLPEKYNTSIGERGSRLSGGQKQRIAIARAIIKGAPILLLDEATAALDSESEKEVNRCLDDITKGVTTITIAHRLSTVKDADRIIVMEQGKIVEEGTYTDLLNQNGRFKELYDNQFHSN